MNVVNTDKQRDAGSILPLVLVVTVVLALVVVALATYASATLRYGQVVEASADRLAAAQGGLDNALEDIERGTSDCFDGLDVTSPGYTIQSPINGIQPEITCQASSGPISALDAHALIMTGSNGQSGPLLTVTEAASATKIFKGNVFMNRPPVVGGGSGSHTIDLSSNLLIENGNLKYYTPGSCPSTVNLGSHPKQVSLSTGYITDCDNTSDWTRFQLQQPLQPSTTIFTPRTSVGSMDAAGCTVFEPGRYDAPPVLGDYNYFRSGEYYFRDIGQWSISGAFVLAGWPGESGPDIENNKILGNGRVDTSVNGNNNPCHSAWNDPTDSRDGAAFYLGGSSRINVGANGSLEITGFYRDGMSVGLYALEGAARSTLGGNDRLLGTDPGNSKQLSIRGLVWAPYTGLEFSNIVNETVAALTGGAVVSELSAGASANANNFTIGVDTRPAVTSLVITSTATNTGSTTVEAQILWRTTGSVNEYAVLSRRIRGLTPE